MDELQTAVLTSDDTDDTDDTDVKEYGAFSPRRHLSGEDRSDTFPWVRGRRREILSFLGPVDLAALRSTANLSESSGSGH